MAEILNLRRFRKSRRRSESETAAERNRVAFGRSKQERTAAQKAAEHAAHLLDRHRLDRPVPDGSEPDGAGE